MNLPPYRLAKNSKILFLCVTKFPPLPLAYLRIHRNIISLKRRISCRRSLTLFLERRLAKTPLHVKMWNPFYWMPNVRTRIIPVAPRKTVRTRRQFRAFPLKSLLADKFPPQTSSSDTAILEAPKDADEDQATCKHLIISSGRFC